VADEGGSEQFIIDPFRDGGDFGDWFSMGSDSILHLD